MACLCFDSIRRKKKEYGCLFYFSIILFCIGAAIIISAIVANSTWIALGCIGGSVFILLSIGFSIIFWHFGKERDQRTILDYESDEISKRVPKYIEEKLEAAKRKTKERETQQEKDAELERQATMNSVQTCRTDLPGSRVTSNETGPYVTGFAPLYEGSSNLGYKENE